MTILGYDSPSPSMSKERPEKRDRVDFMICLQRTNVSTASLLHFFSTGFLGKLQKG